MELNKVIVCVKTTDGRKKYEVFAESIADAKEKVLYYKDIKDSAIIYARVKKPTIYEIKSAIESRGGYYLSRQTLKFWGQKMKDFSIERHGDDKFIISAPTKLGVVSAKIFDPFTNELKSI